MNLWKKVMLGAAAVAFTTVVSAGVNASSAEASSMNAKDITVDYANQQLTIKESSTTKDTKIYVSVPTISVKTDKTTGDSVVTVKEKTGTEYDLSSTYTATVDISSYAVTKDIYLSFKGNKNTDSILVKIPAANTKLKAVVDAAEATVTINDVTDSKNPTEVTGTEYCTTNGTWTTYTSGTSLSDYMKLGATLRFRVSASTSATIPTTATSLGNDANGDSVDAYVATGHFASNEVKAKISKAANGPKATIDYSARTIKLATGTEYRVTLGTAKTVTTTYTAVSTSEKTVTLSADSIVTAACEFDVRTAATSAKPASLITEYSFEAIPVVYAQYASAKAATTSTDVTTATVLTSASTAAGYKAPYITVASQDAKSVSFTNSTDDVYEIYVSSDSTTPASTQKATATLKAGTTTAVKATEGQYVFARKAGDKTAMTWSSAYVVMGVVPAYSAE
ncbi:MAG: hypothetical protein LUH14_07360 [Clostridiaceae bacterium]|nr:hypothetical protein [Clostridiaceae bacterium]